MKLKFHGCTLTTSPQELRAALPKGYDLVDLESRDNGGSGRLKSYPQSRTRGDINYADVEVPDLSTMEPIKLGDFLSKHIFSILPPHFTATHCMDALHRESILSQDIIRGAIPMGRTLAAMVRNSYPGLSQTMISGQRHYRYEAPDSTKG